MQLRKIPVERLFVAALDKDFVSVAKYQRTKSIPLGLEKPILAFGNSATRLASMGKIGGLTARSIPHGITPA